MTHIQICLQNTGGFLIIDLWLHHSSSSIQKDVFFVGYSEIRQYYCIVKKNQFHLKLDLHVFAI